MQLWKLYHLKKSCQDTENNMTNLIAFYSKQFIVPISITFIAILLHQLGLLSTGPLAVGLLFVILYKWNVTEKQDKTWRFFHALPVSFKEKVLIKVGIPFFFAAIVWQLSADIAPLRQLLDGSMNSSLLSAAALVLASLAATGLGSYIVWFAVLWVFSRIFLGTGALAVFCTVIYLTAAVVKLSEARIAWRKAIFVGAMVGLPVALGVYYTRVPVLNFALHRSAPEIQLLAADELLDSGPNADAQAFVGKYLAAASDARLLRQAVNLADGHEFVPELSNDRWLFLLTEEKELREDILELIRENKEKFSWITAESLGYLESVSIVHPTKCDDDCRDLARLAGELAAQQQNSFSTYIKAKLHDTSDARILYGLHAVERDMPQHYTDDLVLLLEHPNRHIRTKANDLLQEALGKKVVIRNIETFLDKIEADLNDDEKKELKKMIDEYIKPHLISG